MLDLEQIVPYNIKNNLKEKTKMNTIAKKVLILILSIGCLLATTACDRKNCTHSYTATVTKEASCKEAGVRTYTCSVCNDSYTEEIAKLTTHSYTATVTKEASCKEAGVRTYMCSVCNDSYTEEIAKLTTHTWEKASCIKEKTCSTCGKTTGKINPLAHAGQIQCENCGINYFNELVEYVQMYGAYSNNTPILKYSIFGWIFTIEYDQAQDVIKIGIIENPESSSKSISLNIPRDLSSVTYLYYGRGIQDRMKGKFSPSDITTELKLLPYDEFSSYQNVYTSSAIQSTACRLTRASLLCFNMVMDDINLNIGANHLGFIHYPQ